MITGAADPRSLDGQLRSREEALRQVTRDEAAVVLACERLDHARHALGLLHVLAARLAALEADRTDAAVAREARRCARFARAADGAQLRLNPKLAAAFCHRLAALACGEGGAVARARRPRSPRWRRAAPAPGCLTPAHADCLQCCLAGRDYARGRRFLGAAPVARVAAPPPAAARAPRAPPRRPAATASTRRRRRRRRAPPPRAPRRSRASAPRTCCATLYYAGVVEAGSARWAAAANAFRLCATAPAASLSAIAVAALRKLVLCRLLAGAGDPADAGRLPRYAPTCVSRAARAVAGAYLDLASAFATDDDGAALSAALATHADARARDGNADLAARLVGARRRRAAESSVETNQ